LTNPLLPRINAFYKSTFPPAIFINLNRSLSSISSPDSYQIPAQRWTQLSHRRLQAIPSTLTKTNTLLASPLPGYLTTPIVDRFKDLGIFAHTPHQQPNHVLVNEYKPGQGIMPHEDGDAYAPVVATVSLGAPLCLDILPKPSTSKEEDDNHATTTTTTTTTLARPDDDDDKESFDKAQEEEVAGEDEEKQVFNLPTRIYQEPRSLLVTTGTAYRTLMHGIAAVETDEGLCSETVANWALLGDEDQHLRARIEAAGGTSTRGVRVSLTYRDVLKVSAAANKVLGGLARR
jgi:alkylated DNA repair protein alkB family protein 6